jgi:hypothetical protein
MPNLFRHLSCYVYANNPPLIAAEATSFLLIEKKQKIKSERMLPALPAGS